MGGSLMDPGLRGYWVVIKRRIWLIALLVCFGCVATGVYSFYFMKPVYTAKTRLIVNKPNQVQGVGTVLDFGSINTSMMLVNTYKEIIKSSAILEKVAEASSELGLRPQELLGKIKVDVVTNTQVLTISVQDHSYERAVQIVNSVATVFRQEVSTIMGVENVTILDVSKAGTDAAPINIKPELALASAFILSILISIGLSFLIEHFDDRIHSGQELTAMLGIPVLAAIPRIKRKHLSSRKNESLSNSRNVREGSYAGINQ
jgi:capsular polysaccharide biosynthesis protein